MGDSYDEDLLVNPFYKSLITKGKTFFDYASSNRYTICIPRKGTITSSDHSIDQFQNHILKPINETIYQTLNNKHAKINGSFIITTKGFGCVKSVEILFEETFFNKNKESYHVLCIDQPFEGGNLITLPVFKRLETLKNCYDFLWPSHLKHKRSIAQVNQIITLFNESYTRLESESMRHSMDAANTVFTRAMQICLKQSYLRKPASSNRAFMENVKLAVETYVMDGLYKRIFKGISVIMADEDASFNKITRNLSELQVKDLGIKPILCKNIPKVKNTLSDLIRLTTPLEKLCTLKIMITTLSGSSNSVSDKSDLITADDLLPALVFVVVKSDVPNWLANLSYMKNFHFSQSKNDEFQFYLSSVEAAIEHIRSGQLDNVVSMTQAQRLIVVDSLFQRMDSADKYTPISPVDNFFELIRAGNLSAVLKLINDNPLTMQEIKELMCHPLCSCDSCEKMILNMRRDPAAVTVFSRDALGCTALHQAAEFGCVDILYELIKKGAIINATNYHGSTPLHYACQRGHHKAAVILSHYGADINAADNEGNTPLHLAVSHGHVVCAEYLCSQECESRSKSKPNLDAVNENKETPLHIASRWGFSSLVYLLVINGASLTILNKENQTAKDCALNTKILDLFLQATSEIGKELSVNGLDSSNKQNSKELIEGKISPTKFLLNQAFVPSNSSKQSVEFSQLLKAVADGNSVLVREKLGLLNESCNLEDPDNGFVDESLCHPLCQCNNCLTVQKKLVNTATVLNANMTNAEGITLLHVAALRGHEVIVKLLLREAEANPNVFTLSNKRTPLHFTCQYNNIECVNLLLKKGAKTNVKDVNGNTPLHFCCTNGHVESAILLLQKGADVRIINKCGNTPLHNACRWNYVDLVQLLLHYGAPVNVYNKLHILPINCSKDKAIHTAINEVTLKQNTKNKENSDKAEKPKKILHIEGLNTNAITNNNHTNELFSEKDNTCTCPSNSSTAKNKSNCTLHSEWYATNNIETLQNASNSIEAWFNSLETENVKKLKLMSHEIINFNKQQSLRHVSTSEKKYSNFMKNGSLTNVALESDIHQSYSRSNEHFKVLIDGSINNELNYEEPLQNLNKSYHPVEPVKTLDNNLAMYHISLKDDATNEKKENLLIQTNQSNSNTNQPIE